MPLSNFERLINLADEVFAVKSDPHQLSVNPQVIERLKMMHPSCIGEFDDGNGPVAWVLLIPTTFDIMIRFINAEISEKELFELTPPGIKYEALYLCSALVLEEYRRKGIVKKLVLNAIEAICLEHPLKTLFVWPFSSEGDKTAESIAKTTSFSLYKRL